MHSRCPRILSATFILLTTAASPALAWGPVGHQVIALIAWDTLTEPTRLKAVELMQQAPPDRQPREPLPEGQQPSGGPPTGLLPHRRDVA